jgi:hypothetical protein
MNFIKMDEWVPRITFSSDGLSMAPAYALLRRELLSEEERRQFERERERERRSRAFVKNLELGLPESSAGVWLRMGKNRKQKES